MTDRDAAVVKRTYTILRRYGDLIQGGGDWVPHVPITTTDSLVFASQFTNDTTKIWLLVNRDKVNDVTVELKMDCGSIIGKDQEIVLVAFTKCKM